YYSAIFEEGADLKRLDYSQAAWKGLPEGAIGFWKSQVPDKKNRNKRWAPSDVMLHFFDELEQQGDKQDIRYVLTLLLIRRRVFRLEEERRENGDQETLVAYCPRRDTTYHVTVVVPENERVDDIQNQLAELLQ
ncbi:MAG: hypothetical protein ACWGMZ_11295, partial [Thermoguttaceae bacterium]